MINQESLIRTLNDFIDILSEKQKNVVEKRFGLTGDKPLTLEAIGRQNGVTRERIRQIEAGALDVLRKNIKDLNDLVNKLKGQIEVLGGLRRESLLLEEATHSFVDDPIQSLKKDADKETVKSHLVFVLSLAPYFNYLFEKPNRHSAWYSDKDSVRKMDSVHKMCHKELKKANRPLKLDEYQELLRKIMKTLSIKNEQAVTSYLDVSKDFAFNPFYEFGLSNWSKISPTNVGDKAYLVLEKKGKPMHFSKIADAINEVNFEDNKKAQASTTHNELIKMPEFVLVGRGVYALKNWGFEEGTVKELLVKALNKGSKTFEQLVDIVQKQRNVKDATILINLQDKRLFKRLDNRKYALAD